MACSATDKEKINTSFQMETINTTGLVQLQVKRERSTVSDANNLQNFNQQLIKSQIVRPDALMKFQEGFFHRD